MKINFAGARDRVTGLMGRLVKTEVLSLDDFSRDTSGNYALLFRCNALGCFFEEFKLEDKKIFIKKRLDQNEELLFKCSQNPFCKLKRNREGTPLSGTILLKVKEIKGTALGVGHEIKEDLSGRGVVEKQIKDITGSEKKFTFGLQAQYDGMPCARECFAPGIIDTDTKLKYYLIINSTTRGLLLEKDGRLNVTHYYDELNGNFYEINEGSYNLTLLVNYNGKEYSSLNLTYGENVKGFIRIEIIASSLSLLPANDSWVNSTFTLKIITEAPHSCSLDVENGWASLKSTGFLTSREAEIYIEKSSYITVSCKPETGDKIVKTFFYNLTKAPYIRSIEPFSGAILDRQDNYNITCKLTTWTPLMYVKLQVDDKNYSTSCKISGENQRECIASVNLSVGEHRLKCFASDFYQGRSFYPEGNHTLTIKDFAPVIDFDVLTEFTDNPKYPGCYSADEIFLLCSSSDDTGVSTTNISYYNFTTGSYDVVSCQGNVCNKSWTYSAVGSFNFTCKAIDTVGSESNKTIKLCIVDEKIPTVEIELSPKSTTYSVGTDINITCIGKDKFPANITVQIDTNNYTSLTCTQNGDSKTCILEWSVSAGKHSIKCFFNDTSSNFATAETILNSAPTSPNITISKAPVNGQQLITCVGNDTFGSYSLDDGLSELKLILCNKVTGYCKTVCNILGEGELVLSCEHKVADISNLKFKCRGTDIVGNVGSLEKEFT
jgi:hypothetical protein